MVLAPALQADLIMANGANPLVTLKIASVNELRATWRRAPMFLLVHVYFPVR